MVGRGEWVVEAKVKSAKNLFHSIGISCAPDFGMFGEFLLASAEKVFDNHGGGRLFKVMTS